MDNYFSRSEGLNLILNIIYLSVNYVSGFTKANFMGRQYLVEDGAGFFQIMFLVPLLDWKYISMGTIDKLNRHFHQKNYRH